MNNVQCRVVVVEDEPLIAWQLKRQLKAVPFVSITYLESGKGIRGFLRSSRIDLVITNLRLSDGWVDRDFLRWLEDEAGSLLVLTGLSDKGSLTTIEDVSPITYLHKPFTVLQLRKCIETLCPAS